MQCAERVDHRRQLALDHRLGLPASRSASVSPTQTIGVTPLRQRGLGLVGHQLRRSRRGTGAARSGRRSRSGSRTRRSIAADTSPVKAPCSCAEQSCAPQRDRRCRRAPRATSARYGERHADRDVAAAYGPRRAMAASSASLAARLPFIFQLPTISLRRIGAHAAHHVSTILPMCWFDSISACACGGLGAPGRRWWITGLIGAALEQRPDRARAAPRRSPP